MAETGNFQHEWEEYLKQVEGLTAVQQRIIAAVLGALVADAAAQPLHWIYNHDKMKEILSGGLDPAFSPVSHNPFYTIETGCQSPYGDQMFVQLKCLVKCKEFNLDEFGKEYYAAFGPGSAYDMENVPEYQKGVAKSEYPIKGHWKNGMIKDFVKKYESKQKTGEATADDPDALVIIIPLMAYFAGRGDFIERCKTAVEVLQTYSGAVNSALIAAKILEKYICQEDETGNPKALLQKVAAEWKDISKASPNVLDVEMAQRVEEVVQADFSMSATEATKKFGMACGLPNSLQSALFLLCTCGDYRCAVTRGIEAGGCNCSRVSFIGACMAANEGLRSIPPEWIKKTHKAKETSQLLLKLFE